MSSAKRRPFCVGLYVLTPVPQKKSSCDPLVVCKLKPVHKHIEIKHKHIKIKQDINTNSGDIICNFILWGLTELANKIWVEIQTFSF